MAELAFLGLWMTDRDQEKQLAANLNALMDKEGIRGADLARIVGVTPTTVSLWLSGHRTPRLNMLRKIRDTFGWSWEQLLTDPKSKRPEISPHQTQKLRDQVEREIFERLCEAMGFEKPSMTKR